MSSNEERATLTITITGSRWSDLVHGVEEVLDSVTEENVMGKSSTETGSYFFTIDNHLILDADEDAEG